MAGPDRFDALFRSSGVAACHDCYACVRAARAGDRHSGQTRGAGDDQWHRCLLGRCRRRIRPRSARRRGADGDLPAVAGIGARTPSPATFHDPTASPAMGVWKSCRRRMRRSRRPRRATSAAGPANPSPVRSPTIRLIRHRPSSMRRPSSAIATTARRVTTTILELRRLRQAVLGLPSSASSSGQLQREYHVVPSFYLRGARHGLRGRHGAGGVCSVLWLPSPGAGLLPLLRAAAVGCGEAYAAPAYAQGGCGTCGATAYAPIVYATPIAPAPIAVGYGCGACGTPTAAVTFVPPVAPTPTYGCGGCGSPAVYNAPAPLYVVNQGPDFSGPGVTVPYETYAPPAQYAPPPYYPPYYRPHSLLSWRRVLAYYRGGQRLLPACVLSSACVLRWTALRAPLLARLNPASPITKCKGPLRAGLCFFIGLKASKRWRSSQYKARAQRRSRH